MSEIEQIRERLRGIDSDFEGSPDEYIICDLNGHARFVSAGDARFLCNAERDMRHLLSALDRARAEERERCIQEIFDESCEGHTEETVTILRKVIGSIRALDERTEK